MAPDNVLARIYGNLRSGAVTVGDWNRRAYGGMRGGVVSFHDWHRQTSFAMQLIMILSWAGVMGLLAQISIPQIPVPFTMQTFGVVLGAVLLGTRNGALAQGVYVGAGVAGLPWFQGFAGGWAVFTGTTLGYLVAFPVAAVLVGLMVNGFRIRSFYGLVGVMTLGSAVILLLGWAWLAYGVGPLVHMGAYEAFKVGVLPFLIGDVAKVFIAAGIALPFLPPARDTQ